MHKKLLAVLLLMGAMVYASPFDDMLKQLNEEEEDLDIKSSQLLTFYKIKIPDAHTLLSAYIKQYNAIAKGDFQAEEDIDEEEAEEYLEEQMEEIFEQIEPLIWFYVEYTELKEEEPREAAAMLKLGKLESKSRLLGYKIKEARNNKQKTDKLEKELEGLLAKLFDQKIDRRKREMAEMEEEIEHIKKILGQKVKNRDLIIKVRMMELSGNWDAIEWPE